ncbi:hypothetical protein AXFE_27190 [Acidithrix ferrooxidans]|uniref:Uncharacterized protein n=1 Tax=Acidithrix ferrooxidans TaxID=1280514 RepID=A0A0D8HF76_9ACTN|nr:hypothetical protein AXFE_27190 [Acidithrix ferrooxidans]
MLLKEDSFISNVQLDGAMALSCVGESRLSFHEFLE